MAAVKLTFRKKLLFAQYSLEMDIDNQSVVHLANGSSIEFELIEGRHTLSASIPVQGNKMALVSVQFDVRPGMIYEVTYTWQAASLNAMCTLEVREIPAVAHGDSGVVVARSKGRPNVMMIVSLAIIAIVLLRMIPMLMLLGSFNLPWQNAPVIVTELNVPGVRSGLKITATDMSVAKSKYPEEGETVVAIRFVVENQSKKGISFFGSDAVYVDDVAVQEAFGNDELGYGDLAPGKRMIGYEYYYAPAGAGKIEVNFDVAWWYGGEKYITFSFDLPPQ